MRKAKREKAITVLLKTTRWVFHIYQAFLSTCSYLRGDHTSLPPLSPANQDSLGSGTTFSPKQIPSVKFTGDGSGSVFITIMWMGDSPGRSLGQLQMLIAVTSVSQEWQGWGLWGLLWIHSRKLRFLGVQCRSWHTSCQHSYLIPNWLRADGKDYLPRWSTFPWQPDKEVSVGKKLWCF